MRYKITIITMWCLSLSCLLTEAMQESRATLVASPMSDLSDETIFAPELFTQKTDSLMQEMHALSLLFKEARQKALTTMYSLYNKPERWLVLPKKEPWKQLGTFMPFVQKLRVQPGETVYIFGDIHANVKALLAALKKLRQDNVLSQDLVIQDGYHIVFLGDYTDRGAQGVETWFTLLQLRAANPDPSKLILLRGNHEDVELNKIFSALDDHGYFTDLQKKLGLENYKDETAYEKTYTFLTTQLYNFLPVALYLVCEQETALCVHGGLEVGFDPTPLLTTTDPQKIYMPLGVLKRNTLTKNLPANLQLDLKRALLLIDSVPKNCQHLNFLWNDFTDQIFSEKNERGENCITMGTTLTQSLLKRDNIACVFRGHQHDLAFHAPRNHYGFHTSPTGHIHTIMSFNRLGRDIPVCSAYSFVKLVPRNTFAEWQAWHLHDGQEYPIDLTIKEFSTKKSWSTEKAEPATQFTDNATIVENILSSLQKAEPSSKTHQSEPSSSHNTAQ